MRLIHVAVLTTALLPLAFTTARAADVDQLLRLERYRFAVTGSPLLPAALPGMARSAQELAHWLQLYPQPEAGTLFAYG